jgi:hypothetical protein
MLSEADTVRKVDESFQTFARMFEQRMGRPMTEQEHLLASPAFSWGFHYGVDWSAKLVADAESNQG